jgi:hypothetical protein
MQTVAKVFVILNEILLFIFAIFLPAIGALIAFMNPSLLGLGFGTNSLPVWVIVLALIVWEVLVVISFGLIAIAIENYNNLKKIADNIPPSVEPQQPPRTGRSISGKTFVRAEPTFRAADTAEKNTNDRADEP